MLVRLKVEKLTVFQYYCKNLQNGIATSKLY
jgi:hypothetical protein